MSDYELTVLSLGWGVQSFTLAAMSVFGDVEKPDYVLHADTTWEHDATYRFAAEYGSWLEDRGLSLITCVDESSARKVLEEGCEQTHLPLFTDNGVDKGQLRRSCTHRWKIVPQRRVISRLLSERGLSKRPGTVNQMIGISMDEWTRMKSSDVKYIDLSFPLVDMRMTRDDCILYLKRRGLPVPPKSSCVFCPYHSLYSWYELKERGGKDWETAVMMDKNIRDKRLSHGYKSYLTDRRVPLDELYFGEFTEPTLFDLSEYACDSGHCFL